jgi:hypothetical protein
MGLQTAGILFLAGAAVILSCGSDEVGRSSIDIAEEPGTLIGGSMAFDGTHIWAMSITAGYDTSAVVKINRIDMNGDIVDSFEPAESISGDLAFDGQTLRCGYPFGWETGTYYADHCGIYIIDTETCQLSLEFSIPRYFDDLDGLASAPGTLWVMVMERTEEGQRQEYLCEIDLDTKLIVREFMYPDLYNCTGIAHQDGFIWVLEGFGSKRLVKIDSATGEVIEDHDLGFRILNGIVSMNGNIYLFDEDEDLLYRFEEE